MKITRDNYEICFIEYFDGKLNPVDTAELMLFLSENRDLENEFNSFNDVHIPEKDVTYKDKALLKKGFIDISRIDQTNFEEFCIASLEGDLDETSKNKLNQYLANASDKKNDFLLFQRIKLFPDKNVVFPDHQLLKKQKLFILHRRNFILYASAAAAILLFVLLFTNKKPVNTDNTIAKESTTISKEVNKQEYSGSETSQVKTLTVQSDLKPVMKKSGTDKFAQVKNVIITERNIQQGLQPLNPIEIKRLDIEIPRSEFIAEFSGRNINTPGTFTPKKMPEEKEFELIPDVTFTVDKLSLWTLVEAGLKGVNYLTESELSLQKITTNKGEKVEFNLKPGGLGISSYRKK